MLGKNITLKKFHEILGYDLPEGKRHVNIQWGKLRLTYIGEERICYRNQYNGKGNYRYWQFCCIPKEIRLQIVNALLNQKH